MPPPSSTTKTPDPAPIIPPGCSVDYASSSCYARGYQDGFGRGYARAYDDYYGSSGPNRKAKKDPHAKNFPPECSITAALKQCYKDGFNAGYDKGYEKGEADSIDG